MNTLEWIIWSLFAFITVFAGITRFVKKKKYKKGEWYDTRDVLTLIALPRIIFCEALILLLFIFINFNKLHLLWLFPLIWMTISIKESKRIIKKENIR